MFKEIEKKYLIKNPPKDYKSFPSVEIEQYYLATKNITLRLRKISSKKDKYYLTLKYGVGVVRTEIEPRIPKYLYILLVKYFAFSVIRKTRYMIPFKKYIIELDIYKGEINKLITAEIEFMNLKDFETFAPPKWFYRDVTLDPKYKNKQLAEKI